MYPDADGDWYFYAIYSQPKKYPQSVVLRRWVCISGNQRATPLLGSILVDTVDEARRLIPNGHRQVARRRDDERELVELWV